MIKRLVLALAFGAVALAGCDEPRPAQEETAPAPMEAPVQPPVETPVPTTPPPTSPTDTSTLPADQRASEETVKPESETLFY